MLDATSDVVVVVNSDVFDAVGENVGVGLLFD